MKDTTSKAYRSGKTGQYVITSQRGEKFTAVEGLKVSPRMAQVVREGASGRFMAMSGAERRAVVKDTLRKK